MKLNTKNSRKLPQTLDPLRGHLVEFLVFDPAFHRSRSLIIAYHIIISTELNEINEPNELIELSDDDEDYVIGTF